MVSAILCSKIGNSGEGGGACVTFPPWWGMDIFWNYMMVKWVTSRKSQCGTRVSNRVNPYKY